MTESFKKLKIKLSPDNKLYQDCKEFDFNHVEVKDKLYNKNRTFKQVRISLDYFKNEEIFPVMEDLNLTPSVFLIEPKHCYNWHRDAWRNIAFNTMLNDNPEYLVLFAPDYPNDLPANEIMYTRTEEVRYDPGQFVLFNSQIPHISINTGTENRYLLTIAYYSGEKTKSLKKEPVSYEEYSEVIQYLKDRNLLEE
jgi:hypothetical protein